MSRLLDRALHTAYRWERHVVAAVARGDYPSHRAVGTRLSLEARINTLRRRASEELEELNLRMAYLHGELRGHERENPFRPYVLVNAVVLSVAALNLRPELAHIVVREWVAALGEVVVPLYESLNATLREPLAAGSTPTYGAPVAPERGSQPSAARRNPALLRRWLQLRQLADAPLPRNRSFAQASASYSGNTLLVRAVHALEQRTAAQAAVLGPLHNAVLGKRMHLAGFTKSSIELRVIDIVALTYEHVLRDCRVPEVVRAALAKAQFQLLKHGLFDPEPFLRPYHPARQLLQRLSSATIGKAPDSTMVRLAVHIACELAAASCVDLALFDHALDRFDDACSHLPARGPVTPTLEQTHSAERLQCVEQMAMVLSHFNVDEQLATFLLGPWSHVVAHEAHATILAPKRSASLMAGLVWSVQPKSSRDQRAQLFARSPDLLAGLFDQLSRLPIASSAPDEFKAWLLEAQLAALLPEARGDSPDLATLEAMCALLTQSSQQSEVSTLAAPENLDSNTAVIDLPTQQVPDAQSDACRAYREQVITQLREGIAVDYVLGEVPCRAHLSWISTMASSIRLSIEEVAVPTAVSVGLLLRWIARGQIRFISSEPWFERTVVALLRTADLINRQQLSIGNPALVGALA
jgi:hypothetical protein